MDTRYFTSFPPKEINIKKFRDLILSIGFPSREDTGSIHQLYNDDEQKKKKDVN